MPERITPNPPSPFADADPGYRHILGTFLAFGTPKAGVLSPTMCDRLTVVPDEPLQDLGALEVWPEGLCPNCRAAIGTFNHGMPTQPTIDCRSCGSLTEHDGLCALCRQDAHEAWAAAGSPWRALTIKQPWADAIVHTSHPVWGRKTVENRTWAAPDTHIGTRILIHAGKSADRRALDAGVLPGPDVRGAIIGTALLSGCHFESLGCCGPWGERDVFHWQLTDVRRLATPVPAKGALQMWKPSLDVLRDVVEQEATGR